jgi:Ran GTPase-activating protein (RanGAP) involved in mRNA processing and transport
LWQNSITEAGVGSICRGLRANSTLTQIDLGMNQLGDGGVKQVALALEKNTCLRELGLGFNDVGIAGCRDLGVLWSVFFYLRVLGRKSIKIDVPYFSLERRRVVLFCGQ